MIKRNIIIFEFDSLYQILSEINDFLMLKINSHSQKKGVEGEEFGIHVCNQLFHTCEIEDTHSVSGRGDIVIHDKETSLNYLFDHCLVKMDLSNYNPESDNLLQYTIINEDPLFIDEKYVNKALKKEDLLIEKYGSMNNYYDKTLNRIRIKESDLVKVIKKIIKEQGIPELTGRRVTEPKTQQVLQLLGNPE